MAATTPHTHHDTHQVHDHQPGIPPGTTCELCGMVAEVAHQDQHGITHYYCRHHAPPQAGRCACYDAGGGPQVE